MSKKKQKNKLQMRLELMTFSLLVLHSKGKVLCHRARCTSTAMSYWSTRGISRKEYTQMEVSQNPCREKKKAKFPMNITENYPKYAISGRMEIHPCVLQDIGPLGPLPCSHSTSSANHSKQGIGYR